MDGLIVSTEIVTVLFASAPSTFKFPAISLNLPPATLITPFKALYENGVNVAV